MTKRQWITDSRGKRIAVMLPISYYKKLLDKADEFECIKAYDKAKRCKQEFAPAEEVFKAIAKKA